MAHIPVVLGLTALVAVPTAVGVHFLSTSGKTQTQKTTEQQTEEREVGQQQDLSLTSETQNDDFASFDIDAIDSEEEEIEVVPAPAGPQTPSTLQPEKQQDQDYPPLKAAQLKLPAVTADLMGASEMQAGSIGPRFKDKLLSSPQDKEWIEKTKLWAKKFVNEGTKTSLTSRFVTQRPVSSRGTVWSWINVGGLQARCREAYGRTDWDVSRANIDRNNYWNTVRELCGKKDAVFSQDWNKSE